MSYIIQRGVNQEVAHVLKGKGKASSDQQHVNFVHLGEFVGNSLNTNLVLSNSWILDARQLVIYVMTSLYSSF